MSYFETTEAAVQRLSQRFGIENAVLTAGDLEVASDELDANAPFVGTRPEGQHRQFPREGEEEVPPAVLDWVALRALQLSSDEEPAVKHERAGRVGVTYLHGKVSQNERRARARIVPLLRYWGRRR
jgi:hypothetical protein